MIHRITILFLSLCAIAFAQPSLTNNNLDNLTPTAKDNLEALGVLTDDAGPDNAAVAAAIAEDPESVRDTIKNVDPRGVGGVILDVPCHDGISSTVHPSVVFFPEPWNGYHYWMAHTPFPNAAREYPNICASNDGETWVVPDGLVNPIMTAAEVSAHGGSYTADTALVKIGDYLYCFFNENDVSSTELAWKRSLDGVNWGDVTYTGLQIGATSLNYAGETLYLHGHEGGDIVFYTSDDDGATWSSPTTCSTPGLNIEPWHSEVRYADGMWHMLVQNDSSSTLYKDSVFYLTSSDGETWDGNTAVPVRLTHRDFWGLYRSSFIPRTGPFGLEFDVWASQRQYDLTIPSSSEDSDNVWRISLHRGVQLAWDEKPLTQRDFLFMQQHTWDLPLIQDAWVKTGVNGTINSIAHPLRLTTGTTAGNICITYLSTNAQYCAPPIWEVDTSVLDRRYRKPEILSVTIAPGNAWDSETKAWVLNTMKLAAMTASDLEPMTWAGYGFKLIGYQLYVCANDGTTNTVTDTGITLSSYRVYHLSLEVGGGMMRLYSDGEFVGSFAGAPWNVLSQYRPAPGFAITNGATAADRAIVVGKCSVTRLPDKK